MVRRFPVVVGTAASWTVASLAGMAYGNLLSWPDYVHVNYGFPLTFAVHTLSTIAGPADTWDVELGALSVDLAFWLAGMAVLLVGIAFARAGRKNLDR